MPEQFTHQEIYRKGIDETIFVPWHHPSSQITEAGDDIIIPSSISDSIERNTLAELSEKAQLIIGVDGLSASLLRDHAQIETFNATPFYTELISILPDGALIVAGDPILLLYLSSLVTPDLIDCHYEPEELIWRVAPLLIGSLTSSGLFVGDLARSQTSRRTFLRSVAVLFSSMVAQLAFGSIITENERVASKRNTKNAINDKTYTLSGNCSAEVNADFRIISNMNKMHFALLALRGVGVSFDLPVQPVILYGAGHFFNSREGFSDKALDPTFFTSIFEYYNQFGGIEALLADATGDRASYWLNRLYYDLSTGALFRKFTTPEGKCQIEPFPIPWNPLGNIIQSQLSF